MTDWTPTKEEAATLETYRQAKKTLRDLKEPVRDIGLRALQQGASPAQLGKLAGETAEVFRRIRDANNIPVDPRYEGRAELARRRKAALPAIDQPGGPA
ncbi:hypothetical protein ACIOEX_01505 [Streptomyces sp. NPDC087850]|uniref:hypothetical protein n=1 Tax=Streptomyces sp. NPDC087850 TaxID=3365809 RepID=UPI0038163D31